MQGRLTRTAMFLVLMTPISGFSKVDTIAKAGLGGGIFVLITILVVIAYVVKKTITIKK